MSHPLEKILKSFVVRHNKNHRPFLLALSGGSDSMALFHILNKINCPFEVAHVNHNWRKESILEEKEISNLCKKNKIKFFKKKLDPKKIVGNQEDECRKIRLQFFKELVLSRSLQGVLLGHHADDLAETVLKRVFEGANLANLKGLTVHSSWEGVSLFRPLLEIRKKEIVKYLEERDIAYFVDQTNFELKYLRSRFRKEIFPLMSEQFGKEIVGSLARLAKASEELHEFLEDKLSGFRQKIKQEGDEYCLDLGGAEIKTDFEWKIIIKDFLNNLGLVVSMANLETIVAHIKKNSAKKVLSIGSRHLTICKKSLHLK